MLLTNKEIFLLHYAIMRKTFYWKSESMRFRLQYINNCYKTLSQQLVAGVTNLSPFTLVAQF